MKTSPEGRRQIMAREGVKLVAYRDIKAIPTIGCGHTSAAGAPSVRMGMTISKLEADAILARDLGAVEDTINHHVTVPLEQHEFDAMASFIFNIGGHAFLESTVLKKLNAGDKRGAADAMLLWRKPAALLKRRQAERAQFLGA